MRGGSVFAARFGANMIFYYIRHADPIYDPDSITEHGKVQAEALADRLQEAKINKIFSSSSTRAVMTAEPAAKKLGLEITAFDWAREDLAGRDFGVVRNGQWNWCFWDDEVRQLFNSNNVLRLMDKWYEHECFSEYRFKEGVERINMETDAFFASLGYVHDRENRIYKTETPNDDKVAFFAHGGFGMAFISSILDIPYNIFGRNFEHVMTTGITVIEFFEKDGIAVPKILVYSDYSHLYKNGIKPYHFRQM